MSSKIKIRDFLERYTRKNDIEMCIPLIQRNYKWKSGKEFQVSERGKRNTAHNLIWEIIDNSQNDKSMTLGIVVLYDETQADGKIRRLILDGQQRIITLSLIIRCLVSRINLIQNDSDVSDSYSKSIKLTDEWFEYIFERYFETEGRRHAFMFSNLLNNGSKYSHTGDWSDNDSSAFCKSVDIKRMAENTEEIEHVILGKIPNASVIDCKGLIEYIKNKVYFIVRMTQTPPLDEFLNVNNNKTPFSICDYIKVFLLKDAMENIELSEVEKNERKEEILGLYHEIASYLYKRVTIKNGEAGGDNELYKLVSEKYENIIRHPSVNRMDVVFEDRYNVDEKGKIKPRYVFDKETGKYKYEIDQTAIIEKYENAGDYESAYDREISRIRYFRNVLRGMEEELYTIDSERAVHLNSNAFNSFYVLQAYTDKTFFSIFSEEDIKAENDPQKVINKVVNDEFCIQELCAEEIKKKPNRNAANRFIDSIMQSAIVHDNSPKAEAFNISSDAIFDEVSSLFYEVFDEYIELIKAGKSKNRTEKKAEYAQPVLDKTYAWDSNFLENETQLIENLFEHKIIIPDIQRDYIKGSCAVDFIEDIVHKNNENIINTYFENENIINTYLNKDDWLDESNSIYKYLNQLTEIPQSEYHSIAVEMVKKYAIAILDSKSICTTRDSYADDKRRTLSYLVTSRNISLMNMSEYHTKTRYENMCVCAGDAAKRIVSRYDRYREENVFEDEYKYTASCVVCYFNQQNDNLVIYDGQQRLTTFLCAVGYLKRKEKNPNAKIDGLYRKFTFLGRNQANSMIEYLFTSQEDEAELLKGMSEYICDQTTEAIYNVVKMLKEMADNKTFISYHFFYDRMQVEIYGIDDKSETTQLFMDLNDGMALNGSEIYKAEFNHYMTECKKMNERKDASGSSVIIKSAVNIQKHLDNDFIDIFMGNAEEPEKLEIEYLKKLIEITLIERSNDFLYGSLPKLSEIQGSLTKEKTIAKCLKYIKAFETFYLEKIHHGNVISENLGDVDRNIDLFSESDIYRRLNEQREGLYCEYHFEENEMGNILLYSDYDTILKHFKIKYGNERVLPIDFRLKCFYDFSVNGYMVTDNYGYLYRVKDDKDSNGVKENLRSLLMDMASKDYIDKAGVTNDKKYANATKDIKTLVLTNYGDNALPDCSMQRTLLHAALKQKTDMEIFESAFYGKSINIDISAFRGIIKDKISVASNINLYRAIHECFDLIVYTESNNGVSRQVIKIWNGQQYDDFNDGIIINGIHLAPRDDGFYKDERFYKDDEECHKHEKYEKIFKNDMLNITGNTNKTKRAYLFRELIESSIFVSKLIQSGMCEYSDDQERKEKKYKFKNPLTGAYMTILIKQDDWYEIS